MIYELREYDIEPGKMAAYDKRFEEVDIVRLFEKHGMKVIGFWHTVIGENAQNRITYMLAYEDLGARERCWKSFHADPTWPQKRRETETDGRSWNRHIRNTILAPTSYSPLK